MELELVEGGIGCLQNPNFVARFSDILDLAGSPSFWTWTALALAAIAAMGSVLSRTRIEIFRLHRVKSVISQPLFQFDDDDDTCSSSSSDEDRDEDTEELSSSGDEVSERYFGDYGEENGQNGKAGTWPPDLARGRDVVKAWDGVGLGFGESTAGFVSLWDLNRGEMVRSFLAGGDGDQIPAACMASPAVILSAGGESDHQVALRVWDARFGGQAPAAFAEWQPRLRRRVLGVGSGGGGVDKVVYVRDDVRSVAVVDLRNVRSSPLGRASGDETWWNSDGVLVGGGGEGFEEAVGTGSRRAGSGVASWCRSAVRYLPLMSRTK